MNIGINLEKSIETLYNSLIGNDSIGKKALFVSFYSEFKTDKKVDIEPVDLCKFIFWNLRGNSGVEVFFCDDMLMEKLCGSVMTSGQKQVFLQLPACTHVEIGQTVSSRLERMVEAISKEKKVVFTLAPIILNKVAVFDLEYHQFVGKDVGSFVFQCWQWDKDEKKFLSFVSTEKNLAQFI